MSTPTTNPIIPQTPAPPNHSFTLLLGHTSTGKSTRAIQFAAAASTGSLPITSALPNDSDALLPDSLSNFIPPPLASGVPAHVLLMNQTNHPDLAQAFASLQPDKSRFHNARINSLIPARRRCTFDSPDHPITPLHSLIHHKPEIRVLIIDNLTSLLGRHSLTLIPALLELARRYHLAILATDTPRSRPLPYLHLIPHIHHLPSLAVRRKRTPVTPIQCLTPGPPALTLQYAIQILQTHLAPGPQPVTQLLQHAKECFALSRRTLFRAKQALGIHATRTQNHWLWSLPDSPK